MTDVLQYFIGLERSGAGDPELDDETKLRNCAIGNGLVDLMKLLGFEKARKVFDGNAMVIDFTKIRKIAKIETRMGVSVFRAFEFADDKFLLFEPKAFDRASSGS